MNKLLDKLTQYDGKIFKLNNSPLTKDNVYFVVNNINKIKTFLKSSYELDTYDTYFAIRKDNVSYIFVEHNDLLRNEVYFTSDNVMTNLKTKRKRLVNKCNDIDKSYLEKLGISNNKELLNKCLKDTKRRCPNVILNNNMHNLIEMNIGYKIQYIENIKAKLFDKNIKSGKRYKLLKFIKNDFNKTGKIKFKDIKVKCSLDDDCCICMNGLKEADCMKFPCGHFIHYECALNWSKSSKITACPYCRHKI